MPVFKLGKSLVFPPPDLASSEGLLAIGGDLHPKRIILAYQLGIFPWYNPGEPILWWSPDPRFVLWLEKLHIPRRLLRKIKSGLFRITFDQAFEQTIIACAVSRLRNDEGTWLTPEMIEAYVKLHHMGIAHSVEVWCDVEEGRRLVGGLYGLAIGSVFCGESMFSYTDDASKVAFVALAQRLRDWQFKMIDCQVVTEHLKQFGAEEMPRAEFLSLLSGFAGQKTEAVHGKWG